MCVLLFPKSTHAQILTFLTIGIGFAGNTLQLGSIAQAFLSSQGNT